MATFQGEHRVPHAVYNSTSRARLYYKALLGPNRRCTDPDEKWSHIKLQPEAPGSIVWRKTSQGPPWRASTPFDSRMGMFSCTDGIWAVKQLGFDFCWVFFFTEWATWCKVRRLTLQPVCKVKSRVKLHSIYETLQGRKSIASHLQPLFTASYTKPLTLPGWATVPVGSSSALCSQNTT